MAKIKRINQKESYSTTCSWLNDFANNLSKNANYIDRVKERRNIKKTYSSIEEKMEDMKRRAGFDTISKVSIEDEQSSHSKVSSSCGCSKCDTCDKKKKGKSAKDLSRVLKHIINSIGERENISYIELLHDCRNRPSFNFSELEKVIEPKKLKNWIEKKLEENKSKSTLSNESDDEYVSYVDSHQFDDADDMKPSYIADQS